MHCNVQSIWDFWDCTNLAILGQKSHFWAKKAIFGPNSHFWAFWRPKKTLLDVFKFNPSGAVEVPMA